MFHALVHCYTFPNVILQKIVRCPPYFYHLLHQERVGVAFSQCHLKPTCYPTKNNFNSEAGNFRKFFHCSPLIHCYTFPLVIPPNIVQSSPSFYHPLVHCYIPIMVFLLKAIILFLLSNQNGVVN